MTEGRWRPRLRVVLLASHLAILILAVAGVFGLRLYENVLIRRTESALLGQGALVTAMYGREIVNAFADQSEGSGVVIPRRPLTPLNLEGAEAGSKAMLPVLDLSTHQILGKPATSTLPLVPPHPLVIQAGLALKPILQQAVQQSLAGIRLLDIQGTVVANTHGPEGGSIVERSEVKQALEGAVSRVMRRRPAQKPAPPLASISRGTPLKVYVVMPVIDGDSVIGAVLLVRTPPSLTQTLYAKRTSFSLAAGFMILLVVLLSIWSALTVTRPMASLVRYVRGIEDGGSPEALGFKPVTLEIFQLQEAVTRMANTLKQRATYIEGFARDVSHEFKTPLTSIRGASELLLDHYDTMTEERRRRFIQNMDADAHRLQRLVDRLLEMAKADVLQPGKGVAEVNTVCLALFQRHSDERERLSLDGPKGVKVNIESDLLDSILGNLIDNALLHSDGGAVCVRVKIEGKSLVRVEVENSGEAISVANVEKVFKAFFTTRRHTGGTGLGLSIARGLARSHGGDLFLCRKSSETVFVLLLPLYSVETS